MTSGERGPEVKILRLRNILTSDSQEEPAGATGENVQSHELIVFT